MPDSARKRALARALEMEKRAAARDTMHTRSRGLDSARTDANKQNQTKPKHEHKQRQRERESRFSSASFIIAFNTKSGAPSRRSAVRIARTWPRGAHTNPKSACRTLQRQQKAENETQQTNLKREESNETLVWVPSLKE